MPIFLYKTIDEDGAIMAGAIESADISSAQEYLEARKLYIIKIRSQGRLIANIRGRVRRWNVKRIDIIEFSRNISAMLKAGIPILSSLTDIMGMVENIHFRQVIGDIKRMIEGGMGFSEAVEVHRDTFPDIFLRLVKIGEETGRLDKSFSDIADHLQKMEDLSAAIKRALIYPAFTIVATGSGLVFWLVYVLPKILASLIEMGVKLPFMTRALLVISNFAQGYWFLVLLVPAAAYITAQILKRNERARYYFDSVQLRLPIIKLIVYNKALALFSEQLRILIVAGITIDRSFNIISDVIGNAVFKKAIASSENAISAGSTIADAMKAQGIFPPLMLRMVSVGEVSGTLEQQFTYLSEYYLKKLDDISQKMEKMMEPIVIGVVGFAFAVIIIGLMMPVYDLVANIGKR